MIFTMGQRWISNTESALGLGVIVEVSGRQIRFSFPAAGEERIYAADNAPVSRIIYKPGEEVVTSNQQKLCITRVETRQGLIFYTGIDEAGNERTISEPNLDCFIRLNTPEQRLFSGLLDKLSTYSLRVDTLYHLSRLQQSRVRGLLGSRTSLLRHQIYIANEVAQRYAPRVLLADEVGLGKTIEAGMILHYQLMTGQASRVLIVVPETLIHQWLVEMIRRFHVYASLIDATDYEFVDELDVEDALQIGTLSENIFDQQQIVLCSLEFLMEHEQARQHARASQWDLLIVDEAHHLHWSEEKKSPEYEYIEELSARSTGVLLLTATPEQAGIASHFARLRLLDPSRFHDLCAFEKEEEGYPAMNDLLQTLMSCAQDIPIDALSGDLKSKLEGYLGTIESSSISQVIKDLLDRHGTGRVLFRNTRAAIQGFPERRLHTYPLACPSLYSSLEGQKGQRKLYPEQLVAKELWLEQDPRVGWLIHTVKALYPKKILIICAKVNTAVALDQHLKVKMGIRSSAFHEGLSIIERDRAAAYFAEQEDGAQVLVCSEIGSEGRNFQFSHHLVLFDLPLNPDLLEQRIGRLDRIGQNHAIEIHVPYLLHSVQEKLVRWYHEGINLFTQSCSVGSTLYDEFEEELLPILDRVETSEMELQTLITQTKKRAHEINQALHEGRDRLLELNSCNKPQADTLIAAIEAEENCLMLEQYMAQVFQEYGVENEYHSDNTEILRPTDHMKTSHFPGLKEEGLTVTYSRAKALVREDIEFLSWEHPIVRECMEMILDSELGNTSLATISIKNIQPGALFLESFYTVNCAAPKSLQLDRFLPLTPIRVFMDTSGKNLSQVLEYKRLNQLCAPVKRHLSYPIIQQIYQDLEQLLKHSKHSAEAQLQEIVDQAIIQMTSSLNHEAHRLEALKKVNDSIRDEEIAYFKNQRIESERLMNKAALKLQAIRVVINKI